MTSPPSTVAATVVMPGDRTAERYAVIEAALPPSTTLPYHVHRGEDVYAVVLSGELSVDADGASTRLTGGDDLRLEAGRPWCLRAVQPSRLLFLVVPAGAERLVPALLADGDPDDRLALLAAAGIDIVPGPVGRLEDPS